MCIKRQLDRYLFNDFCNGPSGRSYGRRCLHKNKLGRGPDGDGRVKERGAAVGGRAPERDADLAVRLEGDLREDVGDRADAAAVEGEDRVARPEARAVRGRVRRDGDDGDSREQAARNDFKP